jgi:DNA-binding transcriptional ArsR family regulator
MGSTLSEPTENQLISRVPGRMKVLNADQQDRDQLITVAKALGSEQRLRILDYLQTRAANVSEIAEALAMPLSTANLHLNLLAEAGLIYLSMRPRPDFARYILPPPNFPAYPSGHATAAFSTALIIGLAYRRRLWWVVGLTGASLIALSRVYLGYHYPSDIISGTILGMAVGAGSYGLIVPRQTLLERCQWLLWLQVAIALLVTQMAYLNILPLYLLDWPMADKVLHLLLIGSIAFWLNLWLKGRTVAIGRWAIPLAVLIPFTIALAEEIAQAFSPLRTASLWDLSSDAIGLLLFWWLSQKLLEAGLNTSSPIQPEQSPSH